MRLVRHLLSSFARSSRAQRRDRQSEPEQSCAHTRNRQYHLDGVAGVTGVQDWLRLRPHNHHAGARTVRPAVDALIRNQNGVTVAAYAMAL